MKPDSTNTIFQKAVSFVMHTSKHLFVTGKAGTGKTTFLKYIKEQGFRKMAIVAPTGVAAINAGGVTIHSFFQIPPSTFIPVGDNSWGSAGTEINNPATLVRNLKINRDKIAIIRELEVLVIDEVSMVRADLLDAIDTVLKHIRAKPYLPFGGVQMIFIGDLFQLPPVVRNQEWDLLKKYYASPFFFDAHALKKEQPLLIELKKIYRQKDDRFIQLLNNVRNNRCTSEDLELLHQYYKPGFTPPDGEHYITLSSHNEKADKINQRELDKLPGKAWSFEATIKGAFYENSYPAEKTLFLKPGAQIMFIKNDGGEERRYFNGKIGTIKSISPDKIIINFPNESAELELEEETWENIKYNYNNDTDQIEQDKQGSFSQFPIRLAWAITIHKSQGLTFERAIIDAGSSFAAGQVYVSLSRLTSLDGLVLYSKILPGCISTDQRVVEYSNKEISETELQQSLEIEQRNFIRNSMIEQFDLGKIVEQLSDHHDDYEFRQIDKKGDALIWSLDLQDMVRAEKEVALKFRRQLEQIIRNETEGDFSQLYERIKSGVIYFTKQIDEKILPLIKTHLESIKGQSKVKSYSNAIIELSRLFEKKKIKLSHANAICDALQANKTAGELLTILEAQRKPVYVPLDPINSKPKKAPKGDSARESLKMFREGKSIKEIADDRFLAYSTVYTHLSNFIPTGEVDIHELVAEEKILKITEVVEATPGEGSSFYKNILGEDYDYSEIRVVMNMLREKSVQGSV